jgi:hypothetical protein
MGGDNGADEQAAAARGMPAKNLRGLHSSKGETFLLLLATIFSTRESLIVPISKNW